jgi:hypothetical protein
VRQLPQAQPGIAVATQDTFAVRATLHLVRPVPDVSSAVERVMTRRRTTIRR